MDQVDDAVIEDLRARMARSAFHGWMGMSFVDARPGEIEIALDVQEHHLNLGGSLHGGVLATLADTAAGLAVRTRLAPEARHVTVHLDVRYLSPGRVGTIVASGRVVRLGRRIAFADAQVHDERGRLLVTAGATIAITPGPGGDGQPD
jgi:uncharacterized protein (TIGR00369 family)